MRSEIVVPFSFVPEVRPGKMGPIFEIRYYTLKAGQLPGWTHLCIGQEAGVVGACSIAGGCPGDNFCASQTSITGCSVSGPVDALGQTVSGVSCSVSITEAP